MNPLATLRRLTIGRSLIVGLILVAFYYFLKFDNGAEQQAAIATIQQQTAETQKQIQENQAKLDRAAVYKKTAAEIGTTIHKLLSVIPERFGTSDLMKILSNEAKVAGTSLAGITPGQSEVSAAAKEFEELSVTIDMTGSFLQHMIFLSNLTKINQILIVRKFDLASAPSGRVEEAMSVHMTAEIIAYRYRGTVASAAKDEAGNPIAPAPAPTGEPGK